MQQPFICSNSTCLLSAMLDRYLTTTAAAKIAGISLDRFRVLMKADTPISILTAAKLKAAFGDNAIKFYEQRDVPPYSSSILGRVRPLEKATGKTDTENLTFPEND